MLKDVWVSNRHRERGITENHRGYPEEKNIRVFGADTETVKGVPYTFQIVDGNDEIIERTTPKEIFPSMMDWIFKRSRSGGVNVVWFHNLNFDLRSIFHQDLQTIYDQYNDIRFEEYGYRVKLLFGKVNQATIWKSKHERVMFLDSSAFCPPGSKSLAAALQIYGVHGRKYQKVRGLGEKAIWTPEFREYALNDARVERNLGLKIMELHKEYDVCLCVSLPQLAARILRHHFFKAGESLAFPPEGCRLASELSYHAGKNGFYVKRGVYENVYEYDINSAFPKAMRELPQLVSGYYRRTKRYRESWRNLGVYRVSGVANGARYPALFDHNFNPIKDGKFRRVWVTGYELDELRKDFHYKFKVGRGWIWIPTGHGRVSPLRAFVDRFWKLKNETPRGSRRDTYKNILNSLYGKFAACVEKRPMVETAFGPSAVNDPKDGGGKFFVAGALYHPFIATQITGAVRAELLRLEKKGEALHAATDSIKTFKRLKTGEKLGELKLECFGRVYLFRTKLYLHFSKGVSFCNHTLKKGWIRDRHSGGRKIKIFDTDGQHLCKWALHGFKGTVKELFDNRFKLLKDGFLDYDYDHMVNLREGIRRGEPVSTMIKREERLCLPA